jgi:hypothetical protein
VILIKPIVKLFLMVSKLEITGITFEGLTSTYKSFNIQTHIIFWSLVFFTVLWFSIFYLVYKPKVKSINTIVFFNIGYFSISFVVVGFTLFSIIYTIFNSQLFELGIYFKEYLSSFILGIIIVILMVMLYQLVISVVVWLIYVFLFSRFIPRVKAMRKYPISI